MDRRLFLTSLLGVVGTTAIASVFPRQAEALVAVPSELVPESDILPEVGDPSVELDEGVELVHRRRRVRRRCRRYRRYGYWRRRCRRVRRGISIWISI